MIWIIYYKIIFRWISISPFFKYSIFPNSSSFLFTNFNLHFTIHFAFRELSWNNLITYTQNSLSLVHIILELPFINLIYSLIFSISMSFTFFPSSFIYFSITPFIYSKTIKKIIMEFPFILFLLLRIFFKWPS